MAGPGETQAAGAEFDDPAEDETREADLGREFGAEVSTRVVVSDREPEAETLELAEERDDDLIVMGTNVRPFSGKAFFGHRVEHVVTHADCPVAVIASSGTGPGRCADLTPALRPFRSDY